MGLMNSFNHEDILSLVSRFEDMSDSGKTQLFTEDEYNRLIDFYEEEFNRERALEVADFAVRQFGFSPEFYVRKAQLLIDCEREEEAFLILDRAEVFAPTEPDIYLLRSEALSRLDLFQDALTLLDERKEAAHGEELSNIYLYEGLVYDKSGEQERMFYALKTALEINPKNDEALQHLYLNVELSRKHHEAIEVCENIIDRNPYSHMAWYQKGSAHYYLCEYDEAIDAYEYAYSINEGFELAYRECAEVCMETKQFQRALKCYAEVMNHISPDSELFLNVGICYKKLGYSGIAKTFFEKSIEENEEFDEPYFHLGTCYAKEKEWKRAIGFYIQAIRKYDGREEYFVALAEAYYQLGEFDKAEKFFREAADIAPEGAEFWLRASSFLLEIGKPEEALDLIEQSEDFTFSPNLNYCRVACYLAMGKRPEAISHLSEALVDHFDAHNALFSLIPMVSTDREIMAMISAFQPL